MSGTFTFDSTHRTLILSAATLNGSTINGYLPGDEIQISDTNLNSGNIDLSFNGDTVSFNGGSFTLSNLGPGRIAVRNLSTSGGVDLKLQQDAHNDFTGDGRSDVLWRSDDGTIADWLGSSNGALVRNYANSASSVTTDWHVAGTGDFNGDGHVDILWRNDNGTIVDWLGNSNGSFMHNYAASVASVPTSWHIVGTGDFNGDGITDILWRSDDGTITDWLGSASGAFTANWANSSAAVSTDWKVVGTGDINGDGYDDIVWQNTTDGRVVDWLGNSNGGFNSNYAHSVMTPGTGWQVVGTGDFNGDGLNDILLRNASGTLNEWLGHTDGSFSVNTSVNTNVPTTWHIASIGDFNGDGIDDVLWQGSDGTTTNWLGTSTGSFTDNWANAATTVPTTWHIQDPFVHDPFA